MVGVGSACIAFEDNVYRPKYSRIIEFQLLRIHNKNKLTSCTWQHEDHAFVYAIEVV